MRIGIDEDASRRADLEAWAAQIAALHAGVARMTATSAAGRIEDASAVADVAALSPEGVRAQVFGSRSGRFTVQDGLGYLQVAAVDVARSREVLHRMQVVAGQALTGEYDHDQSAALQKFLDRSLQELEGVAEQARYHTLQMLGGTAEAWSLPLANPDADRKPDAGGPRTWTSGQPGGTGMSSVAQTAGAVVSLLRTDAPPSALPSSALTSAPTSALSERVAIGTAHDAQRAVRRVEAADNVLREVQSSVETAQEALLHTVTEIGLDHERLSPVGGARREDGVGVRLRLQLEELTRAGASVLVEATRAQFQAVTTVLGGSAGAAVVGAAAPGMREAAMATKPAVERVSSTARSAGTATGRQRESSSGPGGGDVAHR